MHATIFDIKHYAIHDGPGIRQTIFFKGCALSCWWCHNPESRSKSIMEVPNEIKLDDEVICRNETIGIKISIEDLMTEIEKDKVFFEESGGGITLSGGEPLLHLEFIEELLKISKRKNIHTCIDTTGYVNQKSLLKICDNTDLFLYDVKMVDNDKHLKYTGVGNDQIISNLKLLDKLNKDIWIRFPLVPGVNDSQDDIEKFIHLIKDLRNNHPVYILPFHKIGSQKYSRLGYEYRMKGIEEPDNKSIEYIRKQFIKNNIEVATGG